MRLLKHLPDTPDVIYDQCISGVKDAKAKARFALTRAAMISLAQNYDVLGATHQLFTLPATTWGNPHRVVLAPLTKKNLNVLYTYHMVGSVMPGRGVYDRVMNLAPHGKCPFCWFGQVSTLDHFLPKSRYPAYSIHVANLVPCCGDCNDGKGFKILTKDRQILHPYFEAVEIERDVWLYASVKKTWPVTLEYFISPPDPWSAEQKCRLTNYFNDLDLSRRFSVEAVTELVELSDYLGSLGKGVDIEGYLKGKAAVERGARPNSWKSAMFEAVSKDAWYINGGFKNAP